MKLYLTTMALALTLGLASCSKDTSSKSAAGKGEPTATVDATNDPNIVKISVPTIQCETCAERISEQLGNVSSAEKVTVDVDTKTVFVKVANNTPESRRELESAIAKAGYSTESMPREQAAYDNLPKCCKDGGMEKK